MENGQKMAATSKFSHRFSGISVWLEPDPAQTSLVRKEMAYLAQRCGGPEAGMRDIVPHCTLLYNTSLPRPGDTSSESEAKCTRRRRRKGEEMLRQCLRESHSRQSPQASVDESVSAGAAPNNNKLNIKLIPTSHYYFPYPKTADGDKGFGCCISLLILETTPALASLQDIVRATFPPDERHGGGDDRAAAPAEVAFRPHVALVYAPEGQRNVTNGWLEGHTARMERERRHSRWTSPALADEASRASVRGEGGAYETDCEKTGWDAKYLSIWSTEGTLDEWFPIAKIDLLHAQ